MSIDKAAYFIGRYGLPRFKKNIVLWPKSVLSVIDCELEDSPFSPTIFDIQCAEQDVTRHISVEWDAQKGLSREAIAQIKGVLNDSGVKSCGINHMAIASVNDDGLLVVECWSNYVHKVEYYEN